MSLVINSRYPRRDFFYFLKQTKIYKTPFDRTFFKKYEKILKNFVILFCIS